LKTLLHFGFGTLWLLRGTAHCSTTFGKKNWRHVLVTAAAKVLI